MDMCDYHYEVKMDVIAWIEEHYEKNDFLRYREEDADNLYNDIYDACWVEDSVTGNASGSYTFNSYKAWENLYGNIGLLKEAMEEFCCDHSSVQGEEWCDVTIRCYVLGEVVSDAIAEAFSEE